MTPESIPICVLCFSFYLELIQHRKDFCPLCGERVVARVILNYLHMKITNRQGGLVRVNGQQTQVCGCDLLGEEEGEF